MKVYRDISSKKNLNNTLELLVQNVCLIDIGIIYFESTTFPLKLEINPWSPGGTFMVQKMYNFPYARLSKINLKKKFEILVHWL